MPFRTRLNLRQNWPLWVAVLLPVLALLYFLSMATKPLNYPFDRTVIYPFVLIVHATTFYLFCFSLLFLLIAGLWALVAVNREEILKLFGISTVLAVVAMFTNSFAASIVFLFLCLLIFTIVFAYRQSPKRSVTLIFAMVAVISWVFPLFISIFQDISHQGTIWFNNAVYQVAQIEDGDWDCEEYHFVVYQCDSIGIVCQPRFTSDQYGSCFGYATSPLPTQANFTIDPTNQLYLQLDNERFPIEP